ncbi:MFS transporter [Tsukamurella sp. 8F]|uniref:MFS transporter n=1 Tax=unclassified Tsukamurella TaxID=2633480 RepID=UPI0023BA124A|nr:MULTISPECIES: MFS transporter [unclassified Tsukamurella]MDF0529184.1 MFS transporter [Tsukamurella sp. 8J]MDF0585369.1 MFS transporter [Tsukamurella sp. 8F]
MTTLDSLRRTAASRAGWRDWGALVVLSAAVFLVSMDATVLDIAVPHMTQALDPSATQLLWIVDVYSFVLAALLITAGNLGDRIGRRRILLIGAVGFAAASLIAGMSVSPEMLIAARVVQGIAGATLMPATLALIRSTFADATQRTLAIGVWSAMAAGGAAAGPVIGGWLLEHFFWGSVFVVNVPVAALIVALGPVLVRESRDPAPGRLDPASVALSVLALLPLIYAIKETAAHGFSWIDSVAAVAGVVAGFAFVRRQRQLAVPLIDVGLFGRPAFTVAVLTNLIAVFAVAGLLYFGSQYLQVVHGFGALQSGLVILPAMFANGAAALAAAPLQRRFSVRTVLLGALFLQVAGAVAMVGVGGGVAAFVVAETLIGVGAGAVLTVTSALVLSAVPEDRAGAASAVTETAYEAGHALGVAILGSVATAVFRAGVDLRDLPAELAERARETIGAAMQVGAGLGGGAGARVMSTATESFVSGMHVAAGLSGAASLLCALLAMRLLKK